MVNTKGLSGPIPIDLSLFTIHFVKDCLIDNPSVNMDYNLGV